MRLLPDLFDWSQLVSGAPRGDPERVVKLVVLDATAKQRGSPAGEQRSRISLLAALLGSSSSSFVHRNSVSAILAGACGSTDSVWRAIYTER